MTKSNEWRSLPLRFPDQEVRLKRFPWLSKLISHLGNQHTLANWTACIYDALLPRLITEVLAFDLSRLREDCSYYPLRCSTEGFTIYSYAGVALSIHVLEVREEASEVLQTVPGWLAIIPVPTSSLTLAVGQHNGLRLQGTQHIAAEANNPYCFDGNASAVDLRSSSSQAIITVLDTTRCADILYFEASSGDLIDRVPLLIDTRSQIDSFQLSLLLDGMESLNAVKNMDLAPLETYPDVTVQLRVRALTQLQRKSG
jgi:hypothetical protein